jgi:ribosomal protein S27E
MNGSRPVSWPLNCPACGDRITVEMPLDREAGFAFGTSTCRRGHTLRYRYDAVSLTRLESNDRYIHIPCRTCFTMTLITGNRPRPARCARCAAPFDPDSASFQRPEALEGARTGM